MQKDTKTSRQQSILQALAHMLEHNPGERITTASLARELNVSEAALYRHFPSKTKMFEALIAFVEDTLFPRINLIVNESASALDKCDKILTLVATFAAKNPGLCRLLAGDALTGENERLRKRVGQVFERLETQLKQILRKAELEEGVVAVESAETIANLFLACLEGRIMQYVRSGFKRSPLDGWREQWRILSASVFKASRYSDVG